MSANSDQQPPLDPVAIMAGLHCGYAIVNEDGGEEPCGCPAASWRWYQDVEHEDSLDVACDWHENEGGRRLHAAEAERDRLAAEVTTLRSQVADAWDEGYQFAADEAPAAFGFALPGPLDFDNPYRAARLVGQGAADQPQR